MMDLNLDKKVAMLAFGGNTWINDIATSLSAAGAKVVIVGNDGEKVNTIAMMLKKKRHEAIGITTNTLGADEIQKTIRTAIEHFGRIDILVNNFNLEMVKPLLDMGEQEWHQLINANLTSTYFYCKSAGKYMVKQNAGSIINIISGLSERGLINATGYCASLGGVLQLTRALALEWAKRSVRVNAIGVGWKELDIPEEEKDPLESYIPIKRRARAEGSSGRYNTAGSISSFRGLFLLKWKYISY
jgi:NAD(P)-dependent dehydrogenase (short-subunit alcohol dehydrogenase family)